MTFGAETKIYVVQIQSCRYYEPGAPWETVLVTHSNDEAVECADGNAGSGMQARVLRYHVQCSVMRLYQRTRYDEERAKAVADAIAARRARLAYDAGEEDT